MFIAEREGFEPPVACTTTVFKTAAFDHSAISPNAGANIGKNLETQKKESAFSYLFSHPPPNAEYKLTTERSSSLTALFKPIWASK